MKRIASIVAAVLMGVAAVVALDLPVRTINGVEYYYYEVKKNETVYGVSLRLGISRADIVRHNPAAADGLRRGTTLYFPVAEYAGEETDDIDRDATTAPADISSAITGGGTLTAGEIPAPAPVVEEKTSLVEIMLPFGAENAEPSRRNLHFIDFYKGFLIAADTLCDRPGRIVVDARDFTANIPDSLLRRASVLIAPDDAAAMPELARRAAECGTYVLNLFDTRDTLFMTNPYVMQANIPAISMYAKAIEGLFERYPDCVPVIVRNTSGRNEKDPFTAALASHCRRRAIEFMQIDYEGNLVTADLAPLASARRYVLVPSSGSLAEFNRFAHVVANYRATLAGENALALEADTLGAVADMPAKSLEVFGYPDWLAFRGEAEELLHTLGATIYSRFYDDAMSFASRNINDDFRHWYGRPMIESVPSQGLLGYDAGCYIIRSLQNSGGTFDPETARPYTGIQSTFRFERVGGGGYVNTALYIITYLPDGRMEARVI